MSETKKIPKVMVVEDEQDLREILQFEIEEAGFEALTVKNGHEALSVLEQADVDVILSDLCMPEMSGTQLLQNVRALGYYKPFIVISGYGTRTEAIELMRLGAMDFLEKPFDPKVLNECLREAVRLSQALPVLKLEVEQSLSNMGGVTPAHQARTVIHLSHLRFLRLA